MTALTVERRATVYHVCYGGNTVAEFRDPVNAAECRDAMDALNLFNPPNPAQRRAMQAIRDRLYARERANVVTPKPRRARGANAETALQGDIARALTRAGCYVERRNSGMVETKAGTRVHLSPPGTPDLFVLLPSGRAWFVEVKTPKGDVTPIQAAMHETLRRHGGLVDVARSVDEALALLAQYK